MGWYYYIAIGGDCVTIRKINYTVIAPEVEQDIKDRYTKTETDSKLDGKVNNSQVLTSVPANAKFTDTTYSEVSESEIDVGTSTALRVITGRRLKYILDKVQEWINGLTKTDVGLGNVDNIQQATKAEFNNHNDDNTRHITTIERTSWNNKGSSNLALGETVSTAYRGDRGKVAYDHSQSAHAPTDAGLIIP